MGWRKLGLEPGAYHLPCRVQHRHPHPPGDADVSRPKGGEMDERPHPRPAPRALAPQRGLGLPLPHVLPPGPRLLSLRGGYGDSALRPCQGPSPQMDRARFQPALPATRLLHAGPGACRGALLHKLGAALNRPPGDGQRRAPRPPLRGHLLGAAPRVGECLHLGRQASAGRGRGRAELPHRPGAYPGALGATGDAGHVAGGPGLRRLPGLAMDEGGQRQVLRPPPPDIRPERRRVRQ